jgi:glycine/D-amino acid oxidase-like deaminating enzyme
MSPPSLLLLTPPSRITAPPPHLNGEGFRGEAQLIVLYVGGIHDRRADTLNPLAYAHDLATAACRAGACFMAEPKCSN